MGNVLHPALDQADYAELFFSSFRTRLTLIRSGITEPLGSNHAPYLAFETRHWL